MENFRGSLLLSLWRETCMSLPPEGVNLRNFAVEKGSDKTTLPVMMKMRDETKDVRWLTYEARNNK